ncbi:MAG: transglutaminase domain-containing protein [Verrucomicrobiales bacterium]
MEFDILHVTNYSYSQAAAEAYAEARLSPPSLPTQEILSRRLEISPDTKTSLYQDSWGNQVEFFSLPYRHTALRVANHVRVRTSSPVLPTLSLELSIQEVRQLFSGLMTDIFEYLQPTEVTCLSQESVQWARNHLRGCRTLSEALEELNHNIYTQFSYKPGATDNSTPLETVWQQKAGVCQDFAHVALSILRAGGLPCRYVCGYIESEPPKEQPVLGRRRNLVGAIATHAWVEVLAPGMHWLALDPTNDCWCGEQHVAVSYGRDFKDATPLRGTFKGAGGQKLKVAVQMKRVATVEA